MRSRASAATRVSVSGNRAASVWNCAGSIRMTRDGSWARKLPWKGMPKRMGTSPKTCPGERQPMGRSIPSMAFLTSIFPARTRNSARSSPS